MCKKKIREADGKRLFFGNMSRMWKGARAQSREFGNRSVQVTEETNWGKLKREQSWLSELPLVVKPDMLIGQRGKHDLVKLRCTVDEAIDFCEARLNKELEINGVSGPITHFILEPFIAHSDEYYVSIVPNRLNTTISFSAYGGVEIEDNWAKVLTVDVGVDEAIDDVDMSTFEAQMREKGVDDDRVAAVLEFVRTSYRIFIDLDFALLELNPFCFASDDVGDDARLDLLPLDLVAELDDTAFFKNRHKWFAELEFPHPFGRRMSDEEQYIASLDAKTGASLKLTVLKPSGRIWNLVAGGGASVIFADTVCDLGYAHELANYGEYSGAPNEEETYRYARTVLDLATRFPDGKSKALLIGGGIANFTDVAKTFKGIIHAIKEFREQLAAASMKIFVRRAGPNYELGLDLMRKLGEEIGIPVVVYGPETQMTYIVAQAIEALIDEGAVQPLSGDASASSSTAMVDDDDDETTSKKRDLSPDAKEANVKRVRK
jgi:ATP citrate (pro-S)-lyase